MCTRSSSTAFEPQQVNLIETRKVGKCTYWFYADFSLCTWKSDCQVDGNLANDIIQNATAKFNKLNGRALGYSCNPECGAYREGVRVHGWLRWVDNEVAQSEAKALRGASKTECLRPWPREGFLLSLQVEQACRGITLHTPLWHVILVGEGERERGARKGRRETGREMLLLYWTQLYDRLK